MKILVTVLAILIAMSPMSAANARAPDNQPVIFKSGKWSVRQSRDPMSDKKTCTGYYGKRRDIQLNQGNFYIDYAGRGGISSVTLRFDGLPPHEMRLASDIEKESGSLSMNEQEFSELVSSKRLRVEVLTVLHTIIDEDIDLTGLKEAHAVIAGPKCS